ncbi:MAG: alpha/beta fold hydrolase [Clostridia bacterium]|nr:alpha/beta fold hydrolase [Clostridia bacterium]
MRGKSRRGRARLLWIVPPALIAALAIGFLIYASDYHRADRHALDSLASDARVRVSRTDQGWFFDGPSQTDALVFYPGAKVEETAYAPLLHGLAGAGLDVFLVRMPLRFAFFGIDRADAEMKAHDYARWFVGGHSLGGAMAAEFAAKNGDRVAGVILLGAYTAAALDERQLELVICGTEDGLATPDDIAKGRAKAPARYIEHAIRGGNHAGFGNYGAQSGDGAASISADAQQAETIRVIMEVLADPGAPPALSE